MSTLQLYRPTYNTNIEITANGGSLSVDGGLPLFADFMKKSNLSSILEKRLVFNDERKRLIHKRIDVFSQLLLQNLAGYSKDDASDSLKHNKLFTSFFEKTILASQPTVSRMFQSMTEENISQLERANTDYLEQYYAREEVKTVVIDLDSTHCDTFGRQECTDYNAHYQTFGYHPLVAFDAITGMFLKSQLRSGNVYSSTNVVDFIKPVLLHLLDNCNVDTILIRGDSGFATPELYDLCEELGVYYIIRLKANQRLKRIANTLVRPNVQQKEVERQFDTFDYQASSWTKPRTVMLQNERPLDSLFFTPTFIVTNFEEFIPERIVEMYKGRGVMENYIKEAKLGFFMDKTDSSSFITNQARMWLSVLSYNLIQLAKTLAFPKEMKKWTIKTIRERVIKVATKIVQHARKTHFRLDETFVYLNDYFSCANAISNFTL